MPKVKFDGITFDSELEVEYYKLLKIQNMYFRYHPEKPIQITRNNFYTPDFVVYYPKDNLIEIIELKGYNPYSKLKDDMIHQVMLSKTENDLRNWLILNDYRQEGYTIKYRKLKFLKSFGFVDWDFKNPNTIANKRKEKINEQKDEIKELRDFKKDTERFYRYYVKVLNNGKLTKSQRDWYLNYVDKLKKEYGE